MRIWKLQSIVPTTEFWEDDWDDPDYSSEEDDRTINSDHSDDDVAFPIGNQQFPSKTYFSFNCESYNIMKIDLAFAYKPKFVAAERSFNWSRGQDQRFGAIERHWQQKDHIWYTASVQSNYCECPDDTYNHM